MSSSTIGSPHHFIAECVEKDMAVSFYYIYFIVGFADSEPASFTAGFTPSVDGNQEIVAAALYIQCDFPVVVDDNGAYIQAMRCYRSDGDGVAVWHDDRSPDAQRIGCRTGRSGDDQPVRLVGGEIGSIDGCVDGNHGRTVTLQYRYLIQTERVTFQFLFFAGYLQYAAVFR